MQHVKRLAWLALFAACSSGALAASEIHRGNHLQDSLQEIESAHSALYPEIADAPALARSMDSLVDDWRSFAGATRDGPATVEALNRFLFNHLGIRSSEDLHDPRNLLPTAVLTRKQGYCVGIAALYLALAERLDLPIHAVSTPSHVFLRYDDGTGRINIETQRAGVQVSDDQYISEEKISIEAVRRGVFMRNLTTDEFLAQVHNNLGVVYSERGDYEKAAREYGTARRLDSLLPAACYNLANDLLRTGRARRAVRLFSRSLRLYERDVWALNNRGLAFKELGRMDEARRDFTEALRIDPDFERAQRNLQSLDPHAPASTSSDSRNGP